MHVDLTDDPDALRAQFLALTAFLKTHRVLWASRPFVSTRLPWEDTHPEVAEWLLHLSPDRVASLDRGEVPPQDMPKAFQTWHEEAQRLVRVPLGYDSATLDEPPNPPGVPKRKWLQVQAFIHSVHADMPSEVHRVVDWCAGKGHLGRTFAERTRMPVISLERRSDLCRYGEKLARNLNIDGITFRAVDVLKDAQGIMDECTAGIGLHACGILGHALLDHAAQAQAPAAFLAPCCYHNLGGAEVHAPRSHEGRKVALHLTQQNLRLAMAEEVIARRAVRRARHREQVFRLGLDRLVREATGEDRYLKQGKFPQSILRLPFPEFCRAAADHSQLPLPHTWRPATVLREAAHRARRVYALGQVRGLFRRSMELWLVLDVALREVERGRQVSLRTFCPRHRTPRNLLLASYRV